MPPEILGNKKHDHRVDIWALGILLYEFLHGKTPFGHLERDKIYSSMMQIKKNGIECGEFVSNEA